MSETGTGSRTSETKSAGAIVTGALTESQAARALGITHRQLRTELRSGLIFTFWVKGRRFVVLPVAAFRR